MFRPSRPLLSLLDGVTVATADPVSRLSAFALSRLALRASKEQRANVGLWRAVAARAGVVAHSMQPSDMSTVLFAFARLRFRDREMVARIAEAVPPILGQFRAADITYFLGALARLDVCNRTMMNLLAREVARKLNDFSAAQLGELVYAYSRLDMRHPLLLDILRKRVQEVVKALKPLHLAMVVSGFARLGCRDEHFFAILASEICRRIADFSGRPLALVANAYAVVGVRNRFLLEVLGDEAFRRRGELEPQSVAMMLNAHARLQMSNPVIFDYFAQDVPRRIRQYNIHSLCLVASAFAKSERPDSAKVFQRIGDHVCGKADNLYPRAVASLLYAFSVADVRHGVLFYSAPALVAQNPAGYTVDELAMIARAYGQFQMVHLPLFDTITSTLPHRLLARPETSRSHSQDENDGGMNLFEAGGSQSKDLAQDEKLQVPRVSSLVWFLEGYARLILFDAPTLQLLSDAIALRRNELDAILVVDALKAAAALSWAHEGLLSIGSNYLERPDELTVEGVEALTRSLRVLNASIDRHPMRALPEPVSLTRVE